MTAAVPYSGKSDLHIEWWPTSRPIPYARNARQIPQQAIDKVAASLQEFGWRQPIVVDTEGVIIAGHTRLLAAQKLGWDSVPVHVATNLSPAQIKAYRLADNRTSDETTWDEAMLGIELAELADLGADLTLTAFNDAELSRLLNGAGENDPDAEWTGMPDFTQPAAGAFRTLIVHFADQQAVDDFQRLVKQPLNPDQKFIWHPLRKRDDLKAQVYNTDESAVSALRGE